jgi:hypothetical protein
MTLVEQQSGLTRFLVVQDLKGHEDGDRFGLYTIDALDALQPSPSTPDGGDSYVGIPVDWAAADVERASDLEAICPLPGSPDEFLACESGYWGGKYGRLFHLRLIRNLPGSATAENAAAAGTPAPSDDPAGWRAEVLGTVQLPQLAGEIEGIACSRAKDGRLLLLLGERGGSPAYAPAWIRWGWLDLGAGTLDMTLPDGTMAMQIDWPEPNCSPWARPISDLYLDAAGYLWIAGASDSGDAGPFRSVVYRAARINPDDQYPYYYASDPRLVWELDGLKIEALAAPAVAGSVMSFATDDEVYGGIFRPLPPAAPPQQSPFYPYGG